MLDLNLMTIDGSSRCSLHGAEVSIITYCHLVSTGDRIAYAVFEVYVCLDYPHYGKQM